MNHFFIICMILFGIVSAHADDLLVFVSLSLPDSRLQSLYKEASKRGGRLIMRGLKDNSFVSTKKKFDILKISVDLDPTLFEAYDIQRVPTFVCRTEKYARKVSGNVSLSHAMEVLTK